MDLYHHRMHHHYRDHPTTGETAFGVVLLLLGIVFVSLPELRRYLRIRSM
ncbi:DUF6893 family small protein [Verrucomicrobiota bacterium sgz303538]